MRDIEQARSLVRLAHRDWMALTGMQGSPLFADEIFGFHAQQAVEKALKAWLCAKDQTYPLTHELLRLLALLENLDADAEPFWPLTRFTAYAVQARYEEGPPEADEVLDRPAIVAEVQVLLRHVAIIVGEQGI